MGEDLERVIAEDVFLGIALDAPALVAHVNEHGFAHVAVGGDAAGHGDFAAFHIVAARLLAGFAGGELVFKGENAAGFQRFELGLALFDE